jgi:sugar phosphate permease
MEMKATAPSSSATTTGSTSSSAPWRHKHEELSMRNAFAYSIYYFVQAFKIFDDESDGLKEEIIAENTTLGVISALFFSTLYS